MLTGNVIQKNEASRRNLTLYTSAEPQDSPTDERLSWIFENVNENQTEDSWNSIFKLIEKAIRSRNSSDNRIATDEQTHDCEDCSSLLNLFLLAKRGLYAS